MWILIILMVTSHNASGNDQIATTTAEFSDLAACSIAASKVENNAKEANFPGKIITQCVKK